MYENIYLLCTKDYDEGGEKTFIKGEEYEGSRHTTDS